MSFELILSEGKRELFGISEEDPSKDLGVALKKVRRKLGLSQVKFSHLAGVDYRHYQNIEGGKIHTKIDTAIKVLNKLGVKMKLHLPTDKELLEISEALGGKIMSENGKEKVSSLPIHSPIRRKLLEEERI